jgi:hypothetical protein
LTSAEEWEPMDLGPAILAAVAFALGGVFNAVLGVGTAAYRAREDEKRLIQRGRVDRLREYRLGQVRSLDEYIRRRLGHLAYWVAGDDDEAAKWADDRDAREPAWHLLGSREVLEAFVEVDTRLYSKGHGGGLTLGDVDRLHVVENQVEGAIIRQEEKILLDQEPDRVSQEQVQQVLEKWWATSMANVRPEWRVPGTRWTAGSTVEAARK